MYRDVSIKFSLVSRNAVKSWGRFCVCLPRNRRSNRRPCYNVAGVMNTRRYGPLAPVLKTQALCCENCNVFLKMLLIVLCKMASKFRWCELVLGFCCFVKKSEFWSRIPKLLPITSNRYVENSCFGQKHLVLGVHGKFWFSVENPKTRSCYPDSSAVFFTEHC